MRGFFQRGQVVKIPLDRRNELARRIHQIQSLLLLSSCPDRPDHHNLPFIIGRSISLLTLRSNTPFHHLFLRNEKMEGEEHQCLLSLRHLIFITITYLDDPVPLAHPNRPEWQQTAAPRSSACNTLRLRKAPAFCQS